MPRSGRPQPPPLTCRIAIGDHRAFKLICQRRGTNVNALLAVMIRELIASAPELRDETRDDGDMLQIQPGTPSYALGALPTKEGKSPVERQQIEDRIREKDAASRSAVRNNKPGFR